MLCVMCSSIQIYVKLFFILPFFFSTKKKKTISTLLLLHPRNQMDPRFNMPRALE